MQVVKEELLNYLDTHALVLAEGIQVHDDVLMSALGHSNGKPYENLYSWAMKYGSLNQMENGVHPGIKKYYHPYRDEITRKNNSQKL